MKFKSIAMLLGTALVWGCSSEDNVLNNPPSLDHLEFSGVVAGHKATRAIDTQWSKGDVIGVFAIPTGDLISQSPDDEDNFNRNYTTREGDGKFEASLFPIRLDGKVAKDIIAYYPYSNYSRRGNYELNVADQSNQEKIDFLFSKNVKGIKDNGVVNLHFTHKMSKFILKVKKGPGVDSFEELAIESLSGLITQGTFNFDKETFTLTDKKENIINLPLIEEAQDVKTTTAYLLPNQSLQEAVLEMKLGASTYKWKFKDIKGLDDITLQSGLSYTFKASLTVKDKDIVLVIDKEGTVIEPWENGHEDPDFPGIDPEEGGDVAVDVESINVVGEATQTKFNISAGETVEWEVSTEADWITLNPAKGKGNAEVSLNVTENTTSGARTAIIKITANGKIIEVTVSQETKKQESGVVLLFEDGFDTVVAKTMQVEAYNALLGDKIVLMPNFSYSNDGDAKIDVRKASGGCIWFPAAGDGGLFLNNIPTKDADKIVVTLSMQLGFGVDQVHTEEIKVYIDETELEIFPKKMLLTTYEDYQITIDKSLFPSDEITLMLTKSQMKQGFRIGNVKIEAYK